MNKLFLIILVILLFFQNNKITISEQEYNDGFRDGLNSCYLCQDTWNTGKFFLFTFAYSLRYNSKRQKGYIDGYCHGANEIYLMRKNTNGNVR